MTDNREFGLLHYRHTFYAPLENLLDLLERLDVSDELLSIESLRIQNRPDPYRTRYQSPLPGNHPDGLLVELGVAVPIKSPPETPLTDGAL